MNTWKGTAVIKKDPILKKMGDRSVLFFTACNTEVIKDASEAIADRKVFWLDCRWENPEWDRISRFKARSLVYLEGGLHQSYFTRNDGSRDWSIVLEVTHIDWWEQKGERGPKKYDNSSE